MVEGSIVVFDSSVSQLREAVPLWAIYVATLCIGFAIFVIVWVVKATSVLPSSPPRRTLTLPSGAVVSIRQPHFQ